MQRKVFHWLWMSIMLATLNTYVNAQKLAIIEVVTDPNTSGLFDIPVSTDLDAITFEPDSILNFVELIGSKRVPVAFQIEKGPRRRLYWAVAYRKDGAKKRMYELVKEKPVPFPHSIGINKKEALIVQAWGKNLLQYNYQTVYPPKGVDTVYKRSGFIHPLWSPKGQELTRISPADHYHHFGVWNPWTETIFEGDTVDFWNLNKKQGTVRFGGFLSTVSGSVFADYAVRHEHVVFKKNKQEKTALHETQAVRVYLPPQSLDYYIMDMSIQLNCASDSPILLHQYRYGGLGWRTTGQWDRNNSEVLTSEGKTRKEADGSKARWCLVQGKVDQTTAGAIMMSYPTNYNHPEPLRVWPENQYNRGDLFVNFSPTKDKSWLIEPKNTYTLTYRFIVFNGTMTKERAEQAWKAFAHPPQVLVTKVSTLKGKK